MDRSDIVEAITVAALRRAGYSITSWDSAVPGFFIDPDIIAQRDGHQFLVLVNASDSFFASQKKIWRNIEEPFESQVALSGTPRSVAVAFISPAAKNALFSVASQLFDAQYLVCDEVSEWGSLLKAIDTESSTYWQYESKQGLAEALQTSSQLHCLNATLESLVSFFSQSIKPRPELRDLWELERGRVAHVRLSQDGIRYSSGHYERRGVELCSLLGPDHLDLWAGAGLLNGDTAVFDPKSLTAVELEAVQRAAKALHVHDLAGKMTRAITDRFTVPAVDGSIVTAIQTLGPARIKQSLDAMFACHPPLRAYVDAASDSQAARRMATAFLGAQQNGRDATVDALCKCSESSSYLGIPSVRNWMLDILLWVSERSQTEVQRHCSIGRLTHAATGQLKLSPAAGREIVDYCWPFILHATDATEIVAGLMKQRLYSLQTHSYANPLYCAVREELNRLASRKTADFTVQGFPERNSIAVNSWHNRGFGSAGEIKVQFIVLDSRSGRELIVRVGSCHDGNVGNKRKEVAAKGRVLSYHWPAGSTPRLAINRRLVLILDGEWEGAHDDPLRHVRMMHEAGWHDVLCPSTLDVISAIWNSHFGSGGND